MKVDYFKFLSKYNLIDVLNNISELSYSRKISILKSLVKAYDIKTINNALQKYNERYIKIKKYNLIYLENTLIYLCKENNE